MNGTTTQDSALVKLKQKGGKAMENILLSKNEILRHFDLKKNKWYDIKDKSQNVVQEDFINNVLLVLDWVISDIEKMNG